MHTFQNGSGLIKCLANGTIETDDGNRGTWKLFDNENRILCANYRQQPAISKADAGSGTGATGKSKPNRVSRGALMLRPVAAVLIAASALIPASAVAQSLDANHPAVLKAGVTTAQIDALTGAHHYIVTAGPGQTTIAVSFRADTLLGAAIKTPIEVQLSDTKSAWKSSFTLVSAGESVNHSLAGKIDKQKSYLLDVFPPRAVVRLGGQYEISFSGGGKEDASEGSGAAEALTQHRYRWFVGCPGTEQTCTGIRFNADGSFTVPGDRRVRKVFDRDASIYTLIWGDTRKSVKYMPARGLVEINDPQVIVIQELQ